MPASNFRTWTIGILSLAVTVASAPALRAAAVALPDGTRVEKVDFERHIMGLFGKMGCNSGSCHGSFQGKGGLRLSLFGYDPSMDYAALTRDLMGRRINRTNPDESLLLLKATGEVEHGGGRRFSADSWQYKLFRQWIADGAAWTKGSGEVQAVEITPKEQAFKKAGESAQLTVKARFGDGTVENVTSLCEYKSNDDQIAEVTKQGLIRAHTPGDAAIVVAYRGNVLSLRALVPTQVKAPWPKEVTEVNYIDREVFLKLRRLNLVPSQLSSDSEFLRRVTLDTIGRLPTPEEARRFFADRSPDKRSRKIEELLADPMHAALWATKFCDITGNNTDLLENPQQLRARRSQQWHDWFRKRVAENMPYDQIVAGVLTATSRGDQPPEEWVKVAREQLECLEKGETARYADQPGLDLYWRRQQNVPIEQWGEKTAAAFLGVRLECAQCHKHPLDRWSQADYRAYANIFTQVNVGASPEARKVIDEENKRRGGGKKGNNRVATIREVFIGNPRNGLTHPDTNAPLPPKALGGPEIKVDRGQDQRVPLMEWMRHPDNPFFAKSFVNRIWGHYFGVGIVDPVDDFSQANPPSNDRLLYALARDFIQHKYDIRHMERIILNSRTYQLSSVPNETNKFDRTNYSHSLVRPLMAEVVVDSLNSALGSTENLGNDAPAGARAIEIGASRVQSPYVMFMFQIFGRPPRASACDCDRAMEPALPQTLFRMTDPNLLAKITSSNGRLMQLLKEKTSDDEVLDELFLATLTRLPTPKERAHFNQHRVPDRQAAFVDALWALLNTREFILNH